MTESKSRIQDDVLGPIRATDVAGEYSATAKLGRVRVKIDLYATDSGDLSPCIRRARKIVERFQTIENKMVKYIELNVLKHYNKQWKPENQKPLTAEQFYKKMNLKYVTTHPGPEATFWFDCGELLHGHGLLLRMGARNQFTAHDMVG